MTEPEHPRPTADAAAAGGPEPPASRPGGELPDADAVDWRQLPPRVTDRINGLEAAKHLRGQVLYVPGRGRLIYEDGAWLPDVMDEAKLRFGDWVDAVSTMAEVGDDDRLRARVERVESAAGQDAALRYVDLELAVNPRELDADPDKLNVANGVVDLRTSKLAPHDPGLLLTHQTAAPLVLTKDRVRAPSLFREFVELVQPDLEQRRYVFKVLGAALLGGNRFRHFVLVHGGTSTGKTTFVELVNAALGSAMRPVNVSVFRGSLDDRPRPDLLRALSARVVYASEASAAWDLHADAVKRLTGGDPIVVRGMHSDRMVEDVPQFTPLIVTNVMPRIRGADDAVRRRLVVLPFTETIAPDREDVGFRNRLVADELSREQVLNALVNGCYAALQDGFGAPPAAAARAAERAFEGFSHVGEFVEWLREEGFYVRDETAAASRCARAADVYRRYAYWVEELGDEADRRDRLGLRQFGEVLRTSFGWELVRSNGSRWAGWVERDGAVG